MTKNLKLNKNYKLPGNLKFINGYDFFDCPIPSFLAEGEGYSKRDIANDPTHVPVYDQKIIYDLDPNGKIIGEEKSPTWGAIIRHEGSVESPVECYCCKHSDELPIEVPTAKAHDFLAMKFKIPDPKFPKDKTKFLIENVFEEVI